MNKLMNNLPKITMYILIAVSLVITAMFWLGGGSTVEINGETLDEPTYTGAYIIWAYILCAIAVALIFIISIIKFVISFIANPKKGITTLLVLAIFAGVFIVSW